MQRKNYASIELQGRSQIKWFRHNSPFQTCAFPSLNTDGASLSLVNECRTIDLSNDRGSSCRKGFTAKVTQFIFVTRARIVSKRSFSFFLLFSLSEVLRIMIWRCLMRFSLKSQVEKKSTTVAEVKCVCIFANVTRDLSCFVIYWNCFIGTEK